MCFFFFQAEDGIRDLVRSRGLGDVYKRQVSTQSTGNPSLHQMACSVASLLLLAFAGQVTANSTVLFQPWDGPDDQSVPKLPCWRIPALVNPVNGSEPGRLLVFAEGRWSNGDGCQVPDVTPPPHTGEPECKGYYRTIFYRESDDSGRTWNNIRRLVGNGSNCYTDPGPIYDPRTQTVVVQFSGRGGLDTWQMSSADLGRSWGVPVLLNRFLGESRGFRPGPAGGTTLTDGRMLVAGYGDGVSVWRSDDSGQSWSLAITNSTAARCDKGKHKFIGGVSESQVVQLSTGAVLLDMRVGGDVPRRAALSVDGGASFNEAAAPAGALLPDAKGNMGSFTQGPAGGLFYSMTISASHDRSHMTVLRSDDDAQTWPNGILVYPGPSAYSDLIPLHVSASASAMLGLAFERDISGCSGQSCSVVWTEVPAELPPYTPPTPLAGL
eukprot:TRINITY_DN29060_c0_g1_i1.p1 TRINITY_DN29060_c0_g1~~TRINITY_DN29060_c0_g1_i1.p1  ORF type:complete len:438 (+),score=59.08 TRINITY_DN29060_c0_g1_i1:11-1324(+)